MTNTILMLILTPLLASVAAFAQFDPYANTLNSHQCNPLNCEEYYGWTYSGFVQTDTYGSCKILGAVEAHGGVEAQGCSVPVFLDSYADTYRESLYNGDTNQIYYDDSLRAFGEAYAYGNFAAPYWRMYNYAYCDGAEPTFYEAPPARC